MNAIIADLALRAFVGVHLHSCIALHGYFSLGKTSGPTTKATGSEAPFSGTVQSQESMYQPEDSGWLRTDTLFVKVRT